MKVRVRIGETTQEIEALLLTVRLSGEADMAGRPIDEWVYKIYRATRSSCSLSC